MIAAAGCGSDEPCSVQSKDYFFEVDRIESSLISVVVLGTDAFTAVDRLEELLEEANDLKPPRCAGEAHGHFVAWLESLIDVGKADATGDRSPKAEEAAGDAFAEFLFARTAAELDFDDLEE